MRVLCHALRHAYMFGVIKRFSAFEICKGEKLAEEKSANPICIPLCVLYRLSACFIIQTGKDSSFKRKLIMR